MADNVDDCTIHEVKTTVKKLKISFNVSHITNKVFS